MTSPDAGTALRTLISEHAPVEQEPPMEGRAEAMRAVMDAVGCSNLVELSNATGIPPSSLHHAVDEAEGGNTSDLIFGQRIRKLLSIGERLNKQSY